MSWLPKDVFTFISLVRERPFMYDPKNSLYKMKGKRLQALKEIAATMSLTRPNTTADECRKKWHSLRTNFMSERRKVVSSKKSGAGVDSLYVPSLFYYEELAFIEDHVSARDSVSSLDEEFEHTPPVEVELEEDIPIFEEGEEGASNVPGPSALLDIVFVEDTPRPASVPLLREKGARSETPSPGISPGPSKRRKITSPPQSSLLATAAEALGGLSKKLESVQGEDMEASFGKYGGNRLRLVKNTSLKNEIIFEIEKIFYEKTK